MRALTPAGALLLAALPLAAQEPAEKPWKDSAELTYTQATGNSRVTTYGADNLLEYDGERYGLELKAGALGSRDAGETKAEAYEAGEKVTRKLAGKLYAYEGFRWEKNRFDDILDRYSASAGVGDRLWSGQKDKLRGEAGAGYVNEERPDKINAFASGRLYAKYVRTLSKTASFSQDAEYLHDMGQAKDYRLNTETAVTAALSSALALKAYYKWKRMGSPPPGRVRDDIVTGVALVVNY